MKIISMFTNRRIFICLLVCSVVNHVLSSDKSGPSEYFQFVGEPALLPCGQEPPKAGFLTFFNTTYIEGQPPINSTIVNWFYPQDQGLVVPGYMYDSLTGLLTVINATLAHGGNYSCFTYDYKAEMVTEIFLYVGVPLESASINGHQTGSNLTAVESCPMSVECGVEGVAPANITLDWSLQPSNPPLDPGVTSTIANDDLTFNVTSNLTATFNRTHHGMTLMCTATHGFNRNNQITANISLIMLYEYRTNVSESRQEEVAMVGGSKSLDCLTVEPGHPPSSHYLWYKDGRLIDEGGGRMLGLGSSQLNITGLWRGDEGEYGCSVNNTAGSGLIEHVFRLYVSRGPSGQPSIVPTDPVILVNTSFTMVCDTSSLNDSGYPLASEYVWTQNRTVVPGENVSTIVIRYDNVTDGDYYTCMVLNLYGKSEVSEISQTIIEALLYVEENSDMKYTPLINDTTFTFNTTVSGSNLRRTWFTKDSNQIPDTDFTCNSLSIEGEFIYDQDQAHLIDCSWSLSNKVLDSCETVTYYDGNYHLNAEGEAAGRKNIISAVFSIKSLYPPVGSSQGNWVTNSSLAIPKNLTCAVCSHPPPHRYIWTFNSKELPDGVADNGNSLGISSVQMHHFGSYVCQVTNMIEGEEFTRDFTIVLVEKGPPHKVKNLQVESFTSKTIQLSWTVGGNGGYEILEHQIEYVELGGSDLQMNYSYDCNMVGEPCQYRIRGLYPETKYSITVRAKNANKGDYLGENTAIEATTTALPRLEPREIVVEEDHITVNWIYEVNPPSFAAVSVSIVIEYKERSDEKYKRHPKDRKISADNEIAKIPGNFATSVTYNVDILVYENNLDEPTMRERSESKPVFADTSNVPVWAIVLMVLLVILILVTVGLLLWKYMSLTEHPTENPPNTNIGLRTFNEEDASYLEPQQLIPSEDGAIDQPGTSYDSYDTIVSDEEDGDQEFVQPTKDIKKAEVIAGQRIRITIDASSLRQKKVLMMGCYGEICKYRKVPTKRGIIKQPTDGNEMVVVKSIAKDHPAIKDFITEGKNMKKFKHDNILKILGFASDENYLLLVLPNEEFGNLCAALKEQTYGVADLAKFCLETAEGMKYLASQTPPIVHGNLRSENLLIDSSYTVSITAIGKRRKDSHYIRWLDQEHLYDEDLPLNEKSDVWAYAVTIGEIFSGGVKPYVYHEDDCIKDIILTRGIHQEKLPNCPSSFHEVMLKCFQEEQDRPNFSTLANEMADITKKKDFSLKRQRPGIMELLAENVQEKIPYYTFNMADIHVVRFLGQGEFGRVTLYKWNKSTKRCPYPSENFAVKVLRVTSISPEVAADVEEFLMEGILAMELKHKNVLTSYGVHLADDIAYIVLPYIQGGSLEKLLKRENVPNHSLISICLGIACGMEYIAAKQYLHRDLATRNVLIGENLCVKVADFGLACDVYSYKFYRDSRKRAHPIKWIAPECHMEKMFTQKSDVWSFGITMWEIFNKAQEPYPGIDNNQIKEHVLGGGRPEKTETCPTSIFTIMKKCWAEMPENRPTFTELMKQLTEVEKEADKGAIKRKRTAKFNDRRTSRFNQKL